MDKEEQIEWLKETYEWCKNFDFSKIPEELNEKFSIDDLILDYSMLWELYKKEHQALINIKELKEKDKQILELTNNWNELEEWTRKLIDDNNNRYELYKDDKLHYEYEISNIKYQNNMLVAFLDKMKEIKEND